MGRWHDVTGSLLGVGAPCTVTAVCRGRAKGVAVVATSNAVLWRLRHGVVTGSALLPAACTAVYVCGVPSWARACCDENTMLRRGGVRRSLNLGVTPPRVPCHVVLIPRAEEHVGGSSLVVATTPEGVTLLRGDTLATVMRTWWATCAATDLSVS